jgi:hypothetical protein
MLSAMLLAISAGALTQFAIYYWRAVVTSVASQPISDRVLAAARLEGGVTADDFAVFVRLYELTPRLQAREHGLGFVRAYHSVMSFVAQATRSHFPKVTAWSRHEMAICARYAAVCVDRRLQDNLSCAAAMRSC